MRINEIKVFRELSERPRTLKELAERIGKSQSWTAKTVGRLREKNLVEKDHKVKINDTYEAKSLLDLLEKYKLEKVLKGKREEILETLFNKPKSISEIEKAGIPAGTSYRALKALKETGVVKKTKQGKYKIQDPNIREYLKTKSKTKYKAAYTANSEKLIKTKKEKEVEGRLTAFSRFPAYNVDYYPKDKYLYQGEKTLGKEKVLIHSLLFSENKKQTSICGVYYLEHQADLDRQKLWKLAEKWNCEDKLTDLLAFLDQREVREKELFPGWNEFLSTADEYRVQPREKHREKKLTKALKETGRSLDSPVRTYLIGGMNLILRRLKDSTKDIDLVLENRKSLMKLIKALKEQGFKELHDLDREYKELEPSKVLEKKGHPRLDLFTNEVAGALHLTEGMKKRADIEKNLGKIKLKLISPTDLLLFKAVSDREGDLEDTALLTERTEIQWKKILNEIKKQEQATQKYFSFTVMDALERLKTNYGLEVPIYQKLESYCLEQALELSLKKPKTIKDLKKEMKFPEYKIYNKLRKLEEEGEIEVDRTGKLNKYKLSN